MKTTILFTNCVHNSRCTLPLVSLLVGCFTLLPTPKAFGVNPPPDGGYSGANTAEGQGALFSLTAGIHNTALGFQALSRNTTGNANMGSGSQALLNNTTGYRNTAAGFSALYSNTTGFKNTAIGLQALYNNITGNTNTATGVQAMYLNTSGSENTANGYLSLFNNTSGLYNTATGAGALYRNMTGTFNTAVGDYALGSNFLGNNNIALGAGAGGAITDGEFNIDIGNTGVFDESNTIRIGDSNQNSCFIAGIRGVTTGQANAIPVLIDSSGQLGTMSSSRRFKDSIKPMDDTSEAILALKPVTFHYKTDTTVTPQFGLIAEEVAEVNPDLVVRDEKGDIYSVRYEAVNAMLLNEFLKEHRTVQELKSAAAKQEATIHQLKSTVAQQQNDFRATIAHQQEQIEALTAGLQRVTSQVEMSRHTPQVVDNRQ